MEVGGDRLVHAPVSQPAIRRGKSKLLRPVKSLNVQDLDKYLQEREKELEGLREDEDGEEHEEEDEEDEATPIQAQRKSSAPRLFQGMDGMEQGQSFLPTPRMCIAILVVGTQGDINPFIQLALKLKEFGHRVRLASHELYRDLITKHAIEYYPLGGDPHKLSEYAVKSEGRLIPKLDKKTWTEEVPLQMAMLKDIINSTWPACTAPDPDDAHGTPFVADAIISNPPTFAHVHVAEALGVPLHMMFPQPWTPTRAFPHPYANEPYDREWSWRNWYSYEFAETLQWLGMRSMLNALRKKLGLKKCGVEGASLLVMHRIPWVKMWSPALAPKPKDWGPHVDVVGNFFTEGASEFTPDPDLSKFLEAGEAPVFIGFGSVVISNSAALTALIVDAATRTNTRVLVQAGWAGLGEGELPANVFKIGRAPHDWLFPRMSAVIHHGGAGTVAAGLKAGKPTMVCPFNADQFFWGEMIKRQGCGATPCPVKKLTADILAASFETLRSPEVIAKAQEMQRAFAEEDGPQGGFLAFHRNLPTHLMVDDVSVFLDQPLMAHVYCVELNMKVSKETQAVLQTARCMKVLRSLPQCPKSVADGSRLTFLEYSSSDLSHRSIIKSRGLFGRKKLIEVDKARARCGVVFVERGQRRKFVKFFQHTHMHVTTRTRPVHSAPVPEVSCERQEEIIAALEEAVNGAAIFRRFDRDNSNYLDAEELSVALRELIKTNKLDNADELELTGMAQRVVNDVGLIHLSEFLDFLKNFKAGKIKMRGVANPRMWATQAADSQTTVQLLQEEMKQVKDEVAELKALVAALRAELAAK